jgi:hypothetical protein
MPQHGDLDVLRVRRRTDPKQPEHPPQQHEPDAAHHGRGSCHPTLRAGDGVTHQLQPSPITSISAAGQHGPVEQIERVDRLGGLIHEYRHAA